MRRNILLIFIVLFSKLCISAQSDKIIRIETQNSELVYSIGKENKLYQIHFGEKLTNKAEYDKIRNSNHEIYIPFGTNNFFESAIRTTHNDGNPSLDFQFVSKDEIVIDENTKETIINLKDNQYPFEVKIHTKAYYVENVLEQWAEIVHHEKNPVTLFNFASSMLYFDAKEYWLTQFHGDWAQEMRMQESKLTSGIKVIDTKLETRADMFQTPFFVVSLNKPSEEITGEVIAGTIAWTGNFKFTFELDNTNCLRIISGINNYASEYKLAQNQIFKTPSFIFAYSHDGKEKVSQNLHNWVRNYSLLDGDKPRMTVLNSWETTKCNFNESKLSSLISEGSKLGADLFLLDDGWFGNKYPRDSDKTSLGDWDANKTKLPNGIDYLVKECEEQNIKFGIWIEPEMVSPKSELYQKHPDWILKLPNRPENYYRNQLVLDLTNPKVQDFVFGVVDNLITQNPGIAYMKWDCNRPMTSSYSSYLKENQSQLYVDYVRGFYSVLERVRAKYPHFPIMLCSGGGSRIDYGVLRYFTEFWPSDNTDPYERVFIQWGFTYYMPAIATCNHITSWGKQSIKFKTDVAMMGKLGYDIQISHLDDKELKFTQEAVKLYKSFRDVVWYGNVYRLVSPYENNRAVLMYTNNDKSKAILFSYTLNARFGEIFEKVKLRGLNEKANYRVKEINLFPDTKSTFSVDGKVFSGDFLIKIGLPVSPKNSLSSSVFELDIE